MKLICEPRMITGLKRPGQGLLDLNRAGFEYLVLDGTEACGPWAFVGMTRARKESELAKTIYLPDEPERLAEAMRFFIDETRKAGIDFPIAYAPYLPRDRKKDTLNPTIMCLAEETVRLAASEHCEAVVVRPLFAGIQREKEWEANRAFYLPLAELVKGKKTKILLENQCKDLEGHLIRGLLSDPTEATEWIDELNEAVGEERFGFCLDVGTAMLCGQDMYEMITTLGKRLEAVILTDCDGHEEQRLLPFTSISRGQPQTDWLSLIRGLREILFDGMLILDMSETAHWVPGILRPQLMSLAKGMMDYFKWQIEMEAALKKYERIVLFGAGNMCRNFLKNYGEKYPPLFTCDNNADRWGKDFYGLTIHDPKDLLTLPKGTGIFICNIFYREIENQLNDLGITEGIEYFNDEYLQTFYMDRLKGL